MWLVQCVERFVVLLGSQEEMTNEKYKAAIHLFHLNNSKVLTRTWQEYQEHFDESPEVLVLTEALVPSGFYINSILGFTSCSL